MSRGVVEHHVVTEGKAMDTVRLHSGADDTNRFTIRIVPSLKCNVATCPETNRRASFVPISCVGTGRRRGSCAAQILAESVYARLNHATRPTFYRPQLHHAPSPPTDIPTRPLRRFRYTVFRPAACHKRSSLPCFIPGSWRSYERLRQTV